MKNSILFILLFYLLLQVSKGDAQNLKKYYEILLLSDKSEYSVGNDIKLKYKILWLGGNDVTVNVNRLSFPVLEIKYLNIHPINLNLIDTYIVRNLPGRHEISTIAPTMAKESGYFVINSSKNPIKFIDGNIGYYNLQKTGAYVLQLKFPKNSNWKMSKDIKETIRSNHIVIDLKNNSIDYKDRNIGINRLLYSIKKEFKKKNHLIETVSLTELKIFNRTNLTDKDNYCLIAHGIRKDRTFKGNFNDELFGLFIVDSLLTKIIKTLDIIPTLRWQDYTLFIDTIRWDKIIIKGKGSTYGDNPIEKFYKLGG